MSLALDVHGVRVRIEGDPAARLGEDLGWFATRGPGTEPADIRLRLSDEPGAARPGVRLFRTRMASARGWGVGIRHPRVCDYGPAGVVESVTDAEGRRRIDVGAATAADRYELGWMALQSALGERLDSRGLHRVHALGLEWRGRAGLVILPQGGGKSSLAALLAERPECRIFSDESPLLGEGARQLPFPMRMALRPEIARRLGLGPAARRFERRAFATKALYPIPAARVAEAGRVDFVLVGRADRAFAAGIRPCSRARVLAALVDSMVVGRGTAQMAEHLLRAETALRLPAVAAHRLRVAAGVARAAEAGSFKLGWDARAAQDELVRWLEARARERA